MKPLLFCFSLFMLISSIMHAVEFLPFSVDLNVAYFRPESKKIRRIYSNGLADYQLNVNVDFAPKWQAWTGISYSYATGHSLCKCTCSSPNFSCERHSTNMTLLPLYFGVRYAYQFTPRTKIYLGGAAAYSFLKINDHFSFVQEHFKKRAFGGLIQIGTFIYIYKQIYLNVSLEYFFQKFNISKKQDSENVGYVKRNDLNLNGFKAGIGLGLDF